MKRAAAAAILVLLCSSACQTPLPPVSNSPAAQSLWAERQRRLDDLRNFALEGRIAGSGMYGGSGNIDWRETDDRFEVLVSGSLGVGALRIEGAGDRFEIVTKDGRYDAGEAESALREKLGAPLPVADLRFWILGLPRPGAGAAVVLDDSGRLGALDQDGWHLDFVDYRDAAPGGPELPHKLSLSSNGNKWRLVIDRWTGVS